MTAEDLLFVAGFIAVGFGIAIVYIRVTVAEDNTASFGSEWLRECGFVPARTGFLVNRDEYDQFRVYVEATPFTKFKDGDEFDNDGNPTKPVQTGGGFALGSWYVQPVEFSGASVADGSMFLIPTPRNRYEAIAVFTAYRLRGRAEPENRS